MSRVTVSRRSSIRIGNVKIYQRGSVWYLCYHENGRRHRPRVGPSLEAARCLAAQTNAQLESGGAGTLTFEPLSIRDLRQRWLEHHEHVLRSSVNTINRYRTATEHLLNFIRDVRPVRLASAFTARDGEAFVRYLRTLEVAPNGHANSKKRRLLDKGLKYVLETCRALFNYAAKRRHLSPYSQNPFSAIEIDRIPVEESKAVFVFTPEQERLFLEACDDWQFPIFLTLILTGLRPGELCHLLLPEDIDLDAAVLRVRNKPKLGWQIKTRSERDVPLVSALAEVLRAALRERRCGPVFRKPRCDRLGHQAPLSDRRTADLEVEAATRLQARQAERGKTLSRKERLAQLRTIWRDIAAWIRRRSRQPARPGPADVVPAHRGCVAATPAGLTSREARH